MAQVGYTPIQLYYSSTATNAPAAGSLAYGELAINITDGKLFYKDNANAVQVIAWKIVPATAGGTGQTSYAIGDLLYANTTTTLAKLADVATGNALISGGVGVAPSWGKIGLTTHISGVLPVANGGTNASTASITSFNNITGYSAAGATGTTTTNLVFSTSPTLTTPSITGDATLSTGNLVVSSGKGVDFSATPGTGTSELFADYEEGTWTPLMSANGGGSDNWTSSTATGRYTKIGRLVSLQCTYTYTAKQSATGDYAWMTGLPFTPGILSGYFYVGINSGGGANTATYSGVFFTGAQVAFVKDQDQSGAGYMTGADFPAATRTITFQASYIV